MKKLISLLVVLAFAAPVWAVDPCQIEIKGYDDGGPGKLRITATTSASGDDPVGISLTLTLTDATLGAEADVLYVDPCYPVYLDYAHDEIENIPGGWDPETNPTPYNFDPPEGHPIADPDAAGDPNLPTSEFSLCLGRLDPCAAPQGTERDLVILQLTQGAGDSTFVNFSADTLRGGVVGSTFSVILPTDNTVSVSWAVSPDCLKDLGGEEYDRWEGYLKPDCWCFKRQASGDADGLNQFGRPVLSDDLAVLAAAYGDDDATLHAEGVDGWCADFDHAMQFSRAVLSDDLAILADYYGDEEAIVPCGDADGDCTLTGADKFNFWTN